MLGTPAEEGGGGKVRMADNGAFDGVDAAMMVHPAGADLCTMDAIAVQQIWVEYQGQAAHAAAFPYKGKNALDAAVLGYMNIAALRQHIRSDERIHGIFTNAGDKPNIVPKFASAQWYVRAATLGPSRTVEEASARLLAGRRRRVRLHDDPRVEGSGLRRPARQRPVHGAVRPERAKALGREVLDHEGRRSVSVVGSTDMGNVSHLVPSIHPMIKVSPVHVSIHTPEFAGYARGDEGDRAVLDGAKAMAMTVADLWLRPEVLAEVKASFDAPDHG